MKQIARNRTQKLSVSLPVDMAEWLRDKAARNHTSVSALITAEILKAQRWGMYLRESEGEYGRPFGARATPRTRQAGKRIDPPARS